MQLWETCIHSIADSVQWQERHILSDSHLPLLYNLSQFLNTLLYYCLCACFVPICLSLNIHTRPLALHGCAYSLTVNHVPLIWMCLFSYYTSFSITDDVPLPLPHILLLLIWLICQCIQSPVNVHMPLSLLHILSQYCECASHVVVPPFWILWMCLFDHRTLSLVDARPLPSLMSLSHQHGPSQVIVDFPLHHLDASLLSMHVCFSR